MNKYDYLSEYFGYSSFRNGQEKVIDAILNGQDALGIMPTGAGKSICFQLPALMQSGVTIVVSPLISLMKDQVNSLLQNSIKAAYINASLTERQISLAVSRMEQGFYKIIYVAPERLLTNQFLSAVKNIEVSIVCVDEAHCVSQWGKDFRPSYVQIKNFIECLAKRPVVCALTATATQKVQNDIVNLIGLRNPDITILSFDRPNLYFSCINPKSKPKEIRKILQYYRGKSGIVYCSSRKAVETLYSGLTAEGYSVAKYHAGMPNEERKVNQDLFITDEREVIIATNAFGMGIDKSNVSFVVHYNMPGDLESYYQEAGRAGRDGNDADCILLYNKQDIQTQLYFIDNPENNSNLSSLEKRRIREVRLSKLSAMIDYTKAEKCLRESMLEYFGEDTVCECENCSVCEPNKLNFDLPIYKRTKSKKQYADDFIVNRYTLDLFEKLRILRKKLADEQGVPAFVIFSDATLKQMAMAAPKNEAEFSAVPGVGAFKLKKYGAVFIKEINNFSAGNK